MKIGVVGLGRVGAACALSLVVRGSAREVVLVDRTRARARAVAADLRYGAPLCPEVALRDGNYADLAGADLVMNPRMPNFGLWRRATRPSLKR